jgi:hypothetical protein
MPADAGADYAPLAPVHPIGGGGLPPARRLLGQRDAGRNGRSAHARPGAHGRDHRRGGDGARARAVEPVDGRFLDHRWAGLPPRGLRSLAARACG